ncbi:MAG TPA: hypothetical protein VFE62_25870 [Gemmataceae bacterium]|nr:hypothetical protein [Gemmataceae bacterium]
MGFSEWRNLSVLVLASAALIGCNNGTQRDGRLVSSNNKAPSAFAGNQNSPGFSTAGQDKFPVASKPTPPSPFAPTSNPNSNSSSPYNSPFNNNTSLPYSNSTVPAGGLPGNANSLQSLPPSGGMSNNPLVPNGPGGSSQFIPPQPNQQPPLPAAPFAGDRNGIPPGPGGIPPGAVPGLTPPPYTPFR